MISFRFTRVFAAALPLVLASLGIAAQNDSLSTWCYTKVGPLMESAGMRVTPAVRKAYVDWAEATAMQELRSKNQTVSNECLAEVDQDPVLREAAFASSYPPDPSVVQNYAFLREQVGAEFTKKYRSLAIAISVARRVKGVEDLGTFDPTAKKPQDFGRDTQAFSWGGDQVHPQPSTPPEKKLVQSIAGYMKENNVAALDLYNDQTRQRGLIEYLKVAEVSRGYLDQIKQSVQFGYWLKNAMIVLGQRPYQRTPLPVPSVWLKHLVSIVEAKPSSSPFGWPIFPIDSAPWPLLMPLTHTTPIDEANWIWETFQGQHGSDRFHTYGPYRDDPTAMPDMLRPSTWYWDAFPDRIVHGGECVPISKGTVDLYSSLGEPAMWAGQPGHANLISFQFNNGVWRANVEQDFCGGPRVTYAQWYFQDDAKSELHFRWLFGWPAAEYHIGLALGMNLGVESYMDTRIASYIFQCLPDKLKPTEGVKMLKNTLLENPFNPDTWYRIGGQLTSAPQALELMRAIRAQSPAGLVEGGTCPDLDRFVKGAGSANAGDDLSAYWHTIEEFVARSFLFDRAAPDDELDKKQSYEFLKQTPGLNSNDLADYAAKLASAVPASGQDEQLKIDQKLADQEDSFGLLRMGQRYMGGDGVPADLAKADQFLTQAAHQGDPAAAVVIERTTPSLPTEGIEVVPSSTYSPTQDVKHLIDGTGLDGIFHDNSGPAASMWQTVDNPGPSAPAADLDPSPAWVRFNFKNPEAFNAIHIWNGNQANLSDRSFRKVHIYGSYDLKKWFLIAATELPRASGQPMDTGVILPNPYSAKLVRSVIIAADAKDGNYGSADYVLSAVRFVGRPVGLSVPAYEITMSASSENSATQDVSHLIDGSGMFGEFHDNSVPAATMWVTASNPPMSSPQDGWELSPAWVRFDFKEPKQFEQVMVWNQNQAGLTNRGFRRARIYGTTNGTDWFPLTDPEMVEIPQARGHYLEAPVVFNNVASDKLIKSVIILALAGDGNYGGDCYGLSAVRFVLRS